MRAPLIAAILLVSSACDGLFDDRSIPAMDQGVPDAADEPDRGPSLSVGYSSSYSPEPFNFNLPDADMRVSRYAENRVCVGLSGLPGDRIAQLRVTRGDEVVHEGPLEAGCLDVPTMTWPDGVHGLRYDVTTEAGERLSRSTSLAVMGDVADIAPDPDTPGLLWLGSHWSGLTAYDLGADGVPSADDRALVYGGHHRNWVDTTPPRGRPWQGEGGYERQTEPAGAFVLAVAHAHGGIYVGAAFRGVSFLDAGGTPWDRSDDRYALFHPGMNLEPETPEAGYANWVTRIVPDGPAGLWLGTLQGLFHVDHGGTPFDARDDRWTVFDPIDPLAPDIADIAIDDLGRLWMTSAQRPLDDAWTVVTVLDPRGTPSEQGDDTRTILLAPGAPPLGPPAIATHGDRALVGTGEGLALLDHGGAVEAVETHRWVIIDPADGWPGARVGALMLAGDDRVWVGLASPCDDAGGGLALLDINRCLDDGACAPDVVYTRADGLADDDITRLVAGPDGTVFASASRQAAFVWADSAFGPIYGTACRAASADNSPGEPTDHNSSIWLDPGPDPTDKSDARIGFF